MILGLLGAWVVLRQAAMMRHRVYVALVHGNKPPEERAAIQEWHDNLVKGFYGF